MGSVHGCARLQFSLHGKSTYVPYSLRFERYPLSSRSMLLHFYFNFFFISIFFVNFFFNLYFLFYSRTLMDPSKRTSLLGSFSSSFIGRNNRVQAINFSLRTRYVHFFSTFPSAFIERTIFLLPHRGSSSKAKEIDVIMKTRIEMLINVNRKATDIHKCSVVILHDFQLKMR